MAGLFDIIAAETTGLGAVLAAAGIGDQKRSAGGKELAML